MFLKCLACCKLLVKKEIKIMPQYKRKPTKRDNDIFRLMFGEDIPGYVPEMTKADSLGEEKVEIERRFLKGEQPRTIGERAYGEKLGIWEEPEEAKPLIEALPESLMVEAYKGGLESLKPFEKEMLIRTGKIKPLEKEPRIPFEERMMMESYKELSPEQQTEYKLNLFGLGEDKLSKSQQATLFRNIINEYNKGTKLSELERIFLATKSPDEIKETKKLLGIGEGESVFKKEDIEKMREKLLKLSGISEQERYFFDK